MFFFAVAVVCYANEGYIERQRERQPQCQSKEKGERGAVGCLEPPRGGEAGQLLDKALNNRARS